MPSNRLIFHLAVAFASVIFLTGCASPNEQRHIVTEDGIHLAYSDRGHGSETLVAPLGVYLEPYLMEALSRKRRVVMYDPRNRGRSDNAPLDSLSLERELGDLETLRRQLGIEKMVLLGWSGKGMEAAVYAARYPNRVSQLILISPLPPASSMMEGHSIARKGISDQAAIDALETRQLAGEFESDPAVHCRLLNALTLPAYLADQSDASRFVDLCRFENEWPENLQAYFGAYGTTYADYDWRKAADNLKVPILVIHGQNDGIPFDAAKSWIHDRETGRAVLLKESGHFPYFEQQQQVIDAIEKFLDGS